jgi:alpha-1,6-mannosyltransferase
VTRIVQLANFYAPESGGLRTALDALGQGYTAVGIERYLIVPGAAARIVESDAGIQITLPGPPLPGGNGYRVLTGRRQVADLLAALEPDRIEVSDKLSLAWVGLWAKRRQIPSLLFSHERLDAILAPRVPGIFPLATVADRWNRRLARQFDCVVTTSTFGCDEFTRIGAPNVIQVPLGVDLDRFSPGTGSLGSAVELVSVGRLSLEKRPDLAIETLRQLRKLGLDARLTIAGDGPLAAQLRAQAGGLPVAFLGHVHGRDILGGVIGNADVALATCGVEAFGLAVLEALACGTPVVTVEGGAACELVDAESGRTASAHGASLAFAVRDLLRTPPDRRRRAARARAERYPWARTVTGMLAAHQLPGVVTV